MSKYTKDMNMYGCTPCPKCGGKYRCVLNRATETLICDECGFEEHMTKINYGLYDEKMRNKQLRKDGAVFKARRGS